MDEQMCVVCGRMAKPDPLFSKPGNAICSIKCFHEFQVIMVEMSRNVVEINDEEELDKRN